MADKFDMEKKKSSGIDLASFDLTPFKEYFEEEDAQKAAEEKAKLEKFEKEEAEKIAAAEAERKARLLEKQERERAAAEQEAMLRAKREKEEARRAAEKEAEAVRAAERAASEAGNIQRGEKAEGDLTGFASILSLDNKDDDEEDVEVKTENKIELTDEFFNYHHEEASPKETLFSVLSALLIIAFLACTAFGGYRYFFAGKNKDTLSNKKYIGSSSDYAPFDTLSVKYPAAAFPQTMPDDLKAAYAINKNTVGWLTIDGTPIDFPIVKYTDNSRYLNAYNFYDKGARYGSPFMDYRCYPVKLRKNTIIYAHHMNNKQFFGSLDNYEDPSFYKKHPYIRYETPAGECIFKVYAVFYATTQPDCDGGYVFDYFNPAMSDENFKGYIELLNQYALYTTDAGLEETDKILTLSTCNHVYDNLRKNGVDSRFVVVGRLLRDGEKADKSGIKATQNTDYRRPQIWYDANKKQNPYTSFRSWKASM